MSENSTHVRDWLLEADMAELRNPPAQIARHITECVTCRSALRSLIDGYTKLDDGLQQLTRARVRPWFWLPLPLVAAAVTVLLVLPRESAPPAPSPILARLMFPDQPVVTPMHDQQAVVMEKNEMTVVWLTNFRGKQ